MPRMLTQRKQRKGPYRLLETEMEGVKCRAQLMAMGVEGYGVLSLHMSKEVLISKCFKV